MHSARLTNLNASLLRFGVLSMLALAPAALLIWALWYAFSGSGTGSFPQHPAPPFRLATPTVGSEIAPAFETIEIDGNDVLVSSGVRLFHRGTTGAAVLFHGCSHTGKVWATGAEERPLVQALLRRKVAVFALSSGGGARGNCWESAPFDSNRDLQHATHVLNTLYEQWEKYHPTSRFRIFGVGASSGGMFVSLLAKHVDLDGIAIYIMPPHPEALRALVKDGFIAPAEYSAARERPVVHVPQLAVRYPRTALVHMPRDTRLRNSIEDAAALLASAPISMDTGRIVTFEVLPRRLNGDTLWQAMPWHISRRASQAVFSALQAAEGGHLLSKDAAVVPVGLVGPTSANNPSDGLWLARDSRSAEVVAAAESAVSALIPVAAGGTVLFDTAAAGGDRAPQASRGSDAQALVANVLEVLNERYAVHEMSAQHAEEVVEWLLR